MQANNKEANRDFQMQKFEREVMAPFRARTDFIRWAHTPNFANHEHVGFTLRVSPEFTGVARVASHRRMRVVFGEYSAAVELTLRKPHDASRIRYVSASAVRRGGNIILSQEADEDDDDTTALLELPTRFLTVKRDTASSTTVVAFNGAEFTELALSYFAQDLFVARVWSTFAAYTPRLVVTRRAQSGATRVRIIVNGCEYDRVVLEVGAVRDRFYHAVSGLTVRGGRAFRHSARLALEPFCSSTPRSVVVDDVDKATLHIDCIPLRSFASVCEVADAIGGLYYLSS